MIVETADFLTLNPGGFKSQELEPEEILRWLRLADAAWVHDGNPEKPHAELTSGLCSNGFFDCLRILKYPRTAEILGYQLVLKLRKMGIEKVNWVVSSPYAAITFGHEAAKALGACFMNPTKDPADANKKKMLWDRMQIPAGAIVLQVEELITTLGTAKEVRRAINDGNGATVAFLPFIGCLVHRPSKLPANYDGVVALVELEIWAEPQNTCPLCKVGSSRLRPKTHWAKLTGKE